MEKIVGLQQRVAELGEADPAFHAELHAVLRHHGVDRKVFPNVAQEIEHADGPHPVGVVEQQGRVHLRVEIEQPPELALDAGNVGLKRIGGKQVALGRLAARVADHAGRATRDCDGPVSRQLEAAQEQQPDEMAEVKAVGRGIEADVERDRFRAGREQALEFLAVGHVGHQPAPLKFLKDRRHAKRLFKRAAARMSRGPCAIRVRRRSGSS